MTWAHHNPDELTLRVFRALYPEYDLRPLGSGYVVVPAGTPWYSGSTLGEIARQICDCQHPAIPSPAPRPGPASPG